MSEIDEIVSLLTKVGERSTHAECVAIIGGLGLTLAESLDTDRRKRWIADMKMALQLLGEGGDDGEE